MREEEERQEKPGDLEHERNQRLDHTREENEREENNERERRTVERDDES